MDNQNALTKRKWGGAGVKGVGRGSAAPKSLILIFFLRKIAPSCERGRWVWGRGVGLQAPEGNVKKGK